jgi:hypothetical protein
MKNGLPIPGLRSAATWALASRPVGALPNLDFGRADPAPPSPGNPGRERDSTSFATFNRAGWGLLRLRLREQTGRRAPFPLPEIQSVRLRPWTRLRRIFDLGLWTPDFGPTSNCPASDRFAKWEFSSCSRRVLLVGVVRCDRRGQKQSWQVGTESEKNGPFLVDPCKRPSFWLMALVGLAGSCRQRLNFGVEQMGASDGHHRAAFACFATDFRATQAYKDVDSGKDFFS